MPPFAAWESFYVIIGSSAVGGRRSTDRSWKTGSGIACFR